MQEIETERVIKLTDPDQIQQVRKRVITTFTEDPQEAELINDMEGLEGAWIPVVNRPLEIALTSRSVRWVLGKVIRRFAGSDKSILDEVDNMLEMMRLTGEVNKGFRQGKLKGEIVEREV